MADLDKLFQKMAQINADRAVLTNDQPTRLFIDGQETAGPVITFDRLNVMLREIAPSELQDKVMRNGRTQFDYVSPHGTMMVIVERNGEALRAAIARMNEAPVTTFDAAEERAEVPVTYGVTVGLIAGVVSWVLLLGLAALTGHLDSKALHVAVLYLICFIGYAAARISTFSRQ